MLTDAHYHPHIYTAAGDPKPDPHACGTNALLPHESSPQLKEAVLTQEVGWVGFFFLVCFLKFFLTKLLADPIQCWLQKEMEFLYFMGCMWIRLGTRWKG